MITETLSLTVRQLKYVDLCSAMLMNERDFNFISPVHCHVVVAKQRNKFYLQLTRNTVNILNLKSHTAVPC